MKESWHKRPARGACVCVCVCVCVGKATNVTAVRMRIRMWVAALPLPLLRCCHWLDANWGVPPSTTSALIFCQWLSLLLPFVVVIGAVPSAAGTTFYLDSAAPHITWWETKKKKNSKKRRRKKEMKQPQIWLGEPGRPPHNVMLFTTNWTYTAHIHSQKLNKHSASRSSITI